MFPLLPSQKLVFLWFPVFLFHTSYALPTRIIPPPNSRNLSVNLPPWAEGRLFAISDTAPFAHHLKHDPDYINSVRLLTDFFSLVEEQINLVRVSSASNGYGAPCNVRPKSWHTATHYVASNRGWPVSEVNESTCITDFYGVPASFPLPVERMREILGQGGSSVRKFAYRIMLDSVGNWTNTEVDVSLPFEFPSQTCDLNNYGGFRLHRKWRSFISLTNEPSYVHLPDGERLSMSEVHRVEKGQIVPALMTLPINPGTGEEHSVTDRATTIMAAWGGSVNPFSRFEPSTAHINVGLKAALAKGTHFVQQMEDAILASNVAILAFPLVLSLVPVSLVTRCEKWRMVVYVLLSDILTALPMLIKGIELWSIGNARFTEVVTRVGDTFDSETIAAEMWIASCRVGHNAQTTGIVLVTVAFLAMVFGVLLEVIARSWVSRARRRRQAEMEEIKYVEQLERTAWKYSCELYQPGAWKMQDQASRLPGKCVHDTWTPISPWQTP